MEKSQFWELIEETTAQGEPEEYIPELVNKLVGMGDKSIFGFANIFATYFNFSYAEKLWAAAYIINGGCSDDGFDYFRAGLIAKGEEAFMAAMEDPDSLSELLDGEEEIDCEAMLAVAMDAYMKLHGLDNDYDAYYEALDRCAYDDADKEELYSDIAVAEDIDTPWDEEDLTDLLPRLSELYGLSE